MNGDIKTWQMLHAISSFIQSSVNHPSKQNALFLNPQMISSIDRASRVSLKVYTTLESHTRGGEGRGEVLLGLIFAENMPLAS